jgi:hypothetical protein
LGFDIANIIWQFQAEEIMNEQFNQGDNDFATFFSKNQSNGAFTIDVKLVLNENLGGILGGTQC